MALPNNRADREFQRFRQGATAGETRVASKLEDVQASVGFSSGYSTRVAVGSTSTVILAANSNRKLAIIMNNTGSAFFLGLGSTAVPGEGFRLDPDEKLTINMNNLWLGSISAIRNSDGGYLDIFEGT